MEPGLLVRRRPAIPGGLPQSVADVLAVGLGLWPDGEAVVSRHSRVTYRQLDDLASRAASVFSAHGVGAGDRVAVSMGNHAELVVAFLGAMRLGAIWVGVNRQLAPPEVVFLLRDSGASIVVADTTAAQATSAAARELPDLEHVLVAEPGDVTSAWSRCIQEAEPRPVNAVDPFAPAAIAYTSGTTGRPKGVVHSQHNLLLPGAAAARLRPDPGARPGVCLPLTILNLVALAPLLSFQQGLPCVLMDRVDAVGIADWVREERVTTFSAVPAMVHDLLTNPEVGDEDLRSLARPSVGGADCPQALRNLFRQRFGRRITTAYGLTEAPTSVTGEDRDLPAVPGAAGRALAHVSLTVRDDAGTILVAGQVGEICVGAASDGEFAGAYTPMLGYWRRPDATAEAFHEDGEVLRTGDLGFLSEDGDLFVTGRMHDLIIRGGANVYPAEVERVLQEIPGVAACTVVGLPDDRLGELVAAAVILDPLSTLTVEDVRAVCATSLARYKVPERILIIDELPRNAMGKIVKREVISLFAG